MKTLKLDFESINLISNSWNIQKGITHGVCHDCHSTINKYQLLVTKDLSFAWWKCSCNKFYKENEQFLVESSEQVYFTLKLIIKNENNN